MSKIYQGYHLDCDQCGERFAMWLIDNPQPGDIKRAWKRQMEITTEPTHKGHDYRFIKQIKNGTREEVEQLDAQTNHV